ncbi:MAG TPA: thiol:disulfide interchange protein, partial [Bacteroidales bacterium]|nr:thiol:disulfide interchange protein [Bacteroidales bacterium]
YVDARTPLDKKLVRTEQYGGKEYDITTVGEHWSMFMMQNYGGLMQPYYVLLSPDGKRLAKPITYTEAQSIEFYTKFLQGGIEAMKK